MSKQNKDRSERNNWIQSAGEPEQAGLEVNKTEEDWEKIARRGRSLLDSEAEAEALLRDLDAAIDNKYAADPSPGLTAGRRRWLRLGMAASILALVSVAAWLLWGGGADPQSLYAKYFRHLENQLTVNLMGASDTSDLAVALRPYNARRYTEAAASIGAYLDRHTASPEVQLYYGISLLQSGATDQAIRTFESMQELTAPAAYPPAADWYLALALLRSERVEEAREILRRLVESEHLYAEQAAALLAELP